MPKLNAIVSRFELYPEEEPTSWIVGFLCTLENGKQFYVGSIVDFANSGNGNGVVEFVW